MELAKIALVLLLMAPSVDSWLCGDKNQCVCSSNGMVVCESILESPLFPQRSRFARGLVIRVADPRKFDLSSLDVTYGFDFVSLTGADEDLCIGVNQGYPWVTCTYDVVATTGCYGPGCTSIFDLLFSASAETETTEVPSDVRVSSGQTGVDDLLTAGMDSDSGPGAAYSNAGQTTARFTGSYRMPSRTASYWTTRNISFWTSVIGGVVAGLILMVIILLILNRKCRGTDKDPVCVVMGCKRLCKRCCVDPARAIGNRCCNKNSKGRTQYRGGSVCSLTSGSSVEEYSRV